MRQQNQYVDSSANAYAGAQMPHMSGQIMEHSSDHFQGQLEAFTPEREDPYTASRVDGQWRWERDESNVSNQMASQMFNEGQAVDASRSYFQGKIPEPKLTVDQQGNNDPGSRSRERDIQIGFGNKLLSQSFEGLEQKFLDDITKLANEQNDAEDAENARHREKIKAINDRYEEKLVALRARHASRRDELLHRESLTRHNLYQQIMMDQYATGGTSAGDHHGYSGRAGSATMNEAAHRPYNTSNIEPYSDQARFLGGARDHGTYPGGRVYDSNVRYY